MKYKGTSPTGAAKNIEKLLEDDKDWIDYINYLTEKIWSEYVNEKILEYKKELFNENKNGE